MNVLLTFDHSYLPYAISLIRSINDYNHCELNFYIFSNDVNYDDLDVYKNYFNNNDHFHIINIDESKFRDAKVTDRYPLTIYYRIFAAKFLPNTLDKILYLDPDIIVKGDLSSLYNIDLGDNYFAGASNIGNFLTRFNQIKNSSEKDAVYLNTGVLLINLKKFRAELNEEEVYAFLERKKYLLTLPDQDVISALYGNKVILVDRLIYNLSDRAITLFNIRNHEKGLKIDLTWVEKNTIIIHFYGKNKPWNEDYHGILKVYYDRYKVK